MKNGKTDYSHYADTKDIVPRIIQLKIRFKEVYNSNERQRIDWYEEQNVDQVMKSAK
jgi:hypothetical protein